MILPKVNFNMFLSADTTRGSSARSTLLTQFRYRLTMIDCQQQQVGKVKERWAVCLKYYCNNVFRALLFWGFNVWTALENNWCSLSPSIRTLYTRVSIGDEISEVLYPPFPVQKSI